MTGGMWDKISRRERDLLILKDGMGDSFKVVSSAAVRFEYKIEYENDFSILICRLRIITTETHLIP